jgi:hypothetical protein
LNGRRHNLNFVFGEKFGELTGRNTMQESSLPDGAPMAIGLRGIIVYGAVMSGTADGETPNTNNGSSSVIRNDRLKRSVANQTNQGQIQAR